MAKTIKTKPKIKASKHLNILLCGGLSFFLLYVLGNLADIQAYTDTSNLPTIKLFILNVFFFATLTGALCSILQELCKFQFRHRALILGLVLLSLLVSYQIISLPDTQGRAVGLSYIVIGDYLRDGHGINIFYMDWGGWALTMTLYLTGIFSALLGIVFTTITRSRLHQP